MNVKVVIGANFGDEGKGLATDYFCNELSNGSGRVLNIRFNGGAQAGHSVTTPDGKHHVFSHFGAGSFVNNVDTYLSKHFIVNPILFKREYEKLTSMGITPRVYVHADAMITIPQDMLINQITERSREDNRHGSCGVGIFETIKRYQSHYLSPSIDYSVKRLKENGISWVKIEDLELLMNRNINEKFLKDMEFFFNIATKVENQKEFLNSGVYSGIVFEGAQGLLLDKDNVEYFPNLTPSNTGLKNVVSIIEDINDPDVEVCYVTRTYFTRHGAGKFFSECNIDKLKYKLVDNTNKPNEFQGRLRYGYFDYDTFLNAIKKDFKFSSNQYKMSIMFTHFNVTGNKILKRDRGYTINEIKQDVKNDLSKDVKIYVSKSKDRSKVKKM